MNVNDLARFASTFESPPMTYVWYRDFAPQDGEVHLSDFTFLGSHYLHGCGTGAALAASEAVTSGATVELEFVERVSAGDMRTLEADVVLKNLSPFTAMFVSLRGDHPLLSLETFEKSAFGGRVLVAPVVRDGVKEIALGVLGGEGLKGSSLSLGKLVFDIDGNDALALRSQDFEVRAADVLLTSGSVARMAAGSTNGTVPVRRVVTNALAQNHPNPFNPTTTISYSIAEPGPVMLAVFGVNGSRVRTLVDGHRSADRYSVSWDGTDDHGRRVASGVYFCRLATSGFTATRKMVLLK